MQQGLIVSSANRNKWGRVNLAAKKRGAGEVRASQSLGRSTVGMMRGRDGWRKGGGEVRCDVVMWWMHAG